MEKEKNCADKAALGRGKRSKACFVLSGAFII